MIYVYLFLLLALPALLFGKVDVKIVDFIKSGGLNYNAAGPVIVKADEKRNRVVAANTLSSSISIIDGFNDRVINIPTGMRAFQHLKNECMTISEKNGTICLIGANAFTLVNPLTNTAETYDTKVQYESVAIDENSQKVFML